MFFFPSLNGLSTIWFNVDWQFVDYAILMKIICYVYVNVMACLHNTWAFFSSPTNKVCIRSGHAFSSGISSSWIVTYIYIYIYIYMHYLILNLSVGRIGKKAIEWDFIIYLNKSDMKINLIQCKSSDENLGKQRKAPSSQLKQ